MYLTKKHLPRRTFLRGAGVTLALPFLDSMVPALSALAQSPANPKTRLATIFAPHGWSPIPTGPIAIRACRPRPGGTSASASFTSRWSRGRTS